jgi:ribosomal protein L11 methyltransferase
LCSHVETGGSLLLAGILERQIMDIQAAYQPYLNLQVADTQEGWVLMRGQAV